MLLGLARKEYGYSLTAIRWLLPGCSSRDTESSGLKNDVRALPDTLPHHGLTLEVAISMRASIFLWHMLLVCLFLPSTWPEQWAQALWQEGLSFSWCFFGLNLPNFGVGCHHWVDAVIRMGLAYHPYIGGGAWPHWCSWRLLLDQL